MKIRQLLWLLPLFAVTGYIACRKMDSQHTNEQPQQTAKENRFFNEHTSTNTQVQAIAGYLQRLNGKNRFAEKAIEKVGYPKWDKAIIVDKKTNRLIESEDSVVITHIPFVRDSQNYVNASLVVRTTPSDTTLNYVCDWQYAQMPYGVPDTDSSAENYAKYFMFFSKRTTGQSAFLITDTFLFSSSPRMHSTDRLKLTILDNNATAGMPETNSVLICYPVLHCGSPDYCNARGGCDAYTGCVQPGTCYIFYDCVSFYSGGSSGGGSGGGPTGGDPGGGTGGGGTGSGGSGSGVPPDCQGPTPARPGYIETNFTCTPGWEPVPDEPIWPLLTDTCTIAHIASKILDSAYIKSKADSVLNTIPNLATEKKEKGFGIYKKFAVNPQNVTDTTITSYYCGNVQTGTDSSISLQLVIPYLTLLAATVHTHPDTGYAAHSARDVFDLIDARFNNPRFEGSLVAAANGSQYSLTVTSPSQAAAFYATMANNLNGKNWNETSAIGKAYKLAYKYFEEKYKANPNKTNLAYEMAMAAVLTQFNTGVVLSKKDTAGNFKPLIVRSGPDPNKPKRTIYTQICL